MMTDRQRIDWLEQKAEAGSSPALLNDDNGHWAVSFAGFQEVPFGDEPQDIATTFIVEKAQWRKTVRSAIDAAMNEAK